MKVGTTVKLRAWKVIDSCETQFREGIGFGG